MFGPQMRGYYMPAEDYFSDKKIRAAFVRKVYTILMIQMLITVGMISLVLFNDNIRFYVLNNFALYISAYVVFFLTFFSIICCVNARRAYPYNCILLVLLTLSMGYMVAMISAYHDTQIVLCSMAITAGVCLAVSLFACQTTFDITGCGGYLCILTLVVLMFGLATMVVCLLSHCRVMMIVYASLIALIFSLYLMYDTQMIMGGRKVELSPEEYIYGAVMLYVDILQIFMAILTLTSMSRN